MVRLESSPNVAFCAVPAFMRVEPLMISDGYAPDHAAEFSNMIRAQVQFCAKFLHSTQTDQKTLRPEVHAKHEEVQMVLSAIANALHVLARKAARHS